MQLRRDFLNRAAKTSFLGVVTAVSLNPIVSHSLDFDLSSFGVVGDGVADDTKALQDAIDFCYINKCALRLGYSQRYLVSNLIIPDSHFFIEGNFSILLAAGPSGSGLLVSHKWAFDKAEAALPVILRNIKFDGRFNIDHGCILQSWNSLISNCDFSNFNLSGICFTTVTRGGVVFGSSTMVNNRIVDCKFWRNSNGISVVDSSRNKITDYEVSGCYFYDNRLSGVALSSSAGWQFTGCHFYGNKFADLTVDFFWTGFRVLSCYFESSTNLIIKDGGGIFHLIANSFLGAVVFDRRFWSKCISLGNYFKKQCDGCFFD